MCKSSCDAPPHSLRVAERLGHGNTTVEIVDTLALKKLGPLFKARLTSYNLALLPH
jgi:hypothetical protein